MPVGRHGDAVDLNGGVVANGTKIVIWSHPISALQSDSVGSDNTRWTLTACNYTVTFNGNGYTSGSTATQTIQLDRGGTALTANGFSRTGYRFNGWNTNSSGTGTNYSNQQSVGNLTSTEGGNVTLYAKWAANTYTVTYDGNGNTGGSTALSSHTYGTAQQLTANGFTRTGYHFNGWNTKSDGTGTNYSNQQSVSNLTSTHGATVILYAK